MPRNIDAAGIASLLAERIEALATELVGSPPTCRSRTELRYYARGGLAVTIAGSRRGIWCHHGDGGIGGDALDLIVHFRKCSIAEALSWARGWLGIGAAAPRPAPAPPAQQPAADYARSLELARRVWRASVPAAGTLVDAYLNSRALTLPPDAPLRFHPACCRGAERLPAMIALMTDPISNRAVGIHRTYLLADGSAKADGEAKMMLGNAGVIRLVPNDQVTIGIGIAEGIETSLAVMQHFGWAPVWAATCARGVGRFPVLVGIECITVFADADDKGVGLDAARTCARRWSEAGREAHVHIPPAGTDWCDAAPRTAA